MGPVQQLGVALHRIRGALSTPDARLRIMAIDSARGFPDANIPIRVLVLAAGSLAVARASSSLHEVNHGHHAVQTLASAGLVSCMPIYSG